MDQTLARWHGACAKVEGGPFPYAAVFVTKSNNSATLLFWAKRDTIDAGLLCSIGGDHANCQQIANEILIVARNHSLVDDATETSVFEGSPVQP
jgi:hypothetical protein